jgi:addiction module RelE/StbE family toxin
MKRVIFHRTFDKHYAKRIKLTPKLAIQFEQRYGLFLAGERDHPLDDHPLTGKLAGKRSFSIAGDIRVIYVETDSEIIFLDVGSHSQVYR